MSKRNNLEDQLIQIKEKLTPFFSNNPYSEVQEIRKAPHLIRPWNDASIAFPLTTEMLDELVPVLNNLILPPRFTAVYHIDNNILECIYTVLEKNDLYCRRNFEFILDRQKYYCKYAEASDRLLALSKLFRRTGKYSPYEYRNLVEIREFINATGEVDGSSWNVFTGMQPISFYIEGFKKYDEQRIVDVAKHINFFMLYYDRVSPFILIHPSETEGEEEKQLPIISESFPSKISTHSKDQMLLDLATTAHRTIPRLQFIYYYQIIEYAAFYYIDQITKSSLLRIINAPDIQAKPDIYIPQILEILATGRQEDEVKLEKVVRDACTPNLIWKEIQPNISVFSKPNKFDGGFQIDPLVDENMSLDSFCSMWHPKLINTLRYIRNALVHGREKKFGHIITPTPRNDRLIKPWVNIIRRIAEEIIIFEKMG
ncbi:hypothetical protein ES703_20047 [subsurface metagenome]